MGLGRQQHLVVFPSHGEVGAAFWLICSTRAVLLTHKSYTGELLMIIVLRLNSNAQGAVTNQLGIIA